MSADPRDDFSAFAGVEHMLFGIEDPFALIRGGIEAGLAKQSAGVVVESIRCQDLPKFLTLGRRREDDRDKIIVTHFASCFRCTIIIANESGRESLPATVTFCFGEVDRPELARMQSFIDLHDDAEPAFEEAAFQQRFLEFRNAEK